MTNPAHIVYLQEWAKDELPYDDIEFSERVFEECGAGGSGKNNNKKKEAEWQDLDLQRFLTEKLVLGSRDEGESLSAVQMAIRSQNGHGRVGGPRNAISSNAFGGVHVVDHDHTILETVRVRRVSNDSSSLSDSGLSFESANTTGTTASLLRNTNRLTVSDQPGSIFNTP